MSNIDPNYFIPITVNPAPINSMPIIVSGAGGSTGPQGSSIIYTQSTGQWMPMTFTFPTEETKIEPEEKKKSDGCTCTKCQVYYEFAEPNQENNTLICWACRHGY